MTIDPVSLAITVALTAASMAVTALQTIEGPRLSDLTVTVADYGTVVNYVYGNRRLNGPVFYAEPMREEKTENKTKGGKYTEYKYFGTLAVLVADHEVKEYRRIWLDHHLVFDAIEGQEASFEGFEDHARFYYGTEDQEPDTRMLATVEAEEGVDTCPAYLGISYIFFEDLPLENFGNRFPQVEFEITGLTKAMIAALEEAA